MQDVRALNEVVARESAFVEDLTAEVGKVVVGQTYMIERILIGHPIQHGQSIKTAATS